MCMMLKTVFYALCPLFYKYIKTFPMLCRKATKLGGAYFRALMLHTRLCTQAQCDGQNLKTIQN